MMRLALIILFCFSSFPSDAADKPDMLTVNQIVQINGAVQNMNCENKIIKDGAKETFVCVPYPSDKLKPGVVWLIAEIQTKTAIIVTQHQRAVSMMRAALDRRPDGEFMDTAKAKFEADAAVLFDKAVEISLPHLKRAEIEPLNLPPTIISMLMPIIDQ